MEKVDGEALLSSIIYHRCTLNFPKIQTGVKTYSLMLEASNLATSIDTFQYDLFISDILLVIAHNIY